MSRIPNAGGIVIRHTRNLSRLETQRRQFFDTLPTTETPLGLQDAFVPGDIGGQAVAVRRFATNVAMLITLYYVDCHR
jgi:hypothetical protein